MRIKGEYRDILTSNGEAVADMGWKSNKIVDDFGRFLAALMKKDSKSGADYMAFGGDINTDGSTDEEFKNRVVKLLNEIPDLSKPWKEGGYWIWAKQIDKSHIKYLDNSGGESTNPTNRIKLEVVVEENEPLQETLKYKEFGLFGVDWPEGGELTSDNVFFINHVIHSEIDKASNVKLSRTVVLKFL